MKKIMIFMFAILMFSVFVIAQSSDPIVCCEQTKSGFYCQDVPESECKPDVRSLPTSCESTSYCKEGTCYDSNEGTCMDNTPQLVCNANDGIWSEENPAQCELGCCVLGDQAAFVTLVRCKKLSSFLGLKTNYNTGVDSEVQCVLTALGQEKGACVFDFEFERTCRITTRYECSEGDSDEMKGEFFSGKLCSSEELGTNCGPSTKTTCVPGRDEVYFLDTCGNPTNIYDSSKINNKDYWTNMKSKTESCNPNSDNSDSSSCGNCNYLLGSYCRPESENTGRTSYGDNICADLNCKNTENGNDYRHGESWCVYDDAGEIGEGLNAVGSRFYKHICINGEEVLEQCADFRQEECTEAKIQTALGDFSQAACTVNRWQDCLLQKDKDDCENKDRRDCLWKKGLDLPGIGAVKGADGYDGGVCFPMNPVGLRFWESEEALSTCSKGNIECIVTYEKDLFGDEKCVDNCECEEDSWEQGRANICMYLGDCGPNINWKGEIGYKPGYETTRERFKGN